MLDLNDFYYFVQVVNRKGISAAAHALDLPKSSVSRRIQSLEEALDVRLLQRTSRSFMVTDAGQEFYRHAVAMLENATAAEQTIRQRTNEAVGTIRFTCSVAFAQNAMATLIPEFVTQYPRVNLIQHATNRYVDLIGEGFDVALRAHSGPMRDSSLTMRSLVEMPWHLFAGPRYLSKHGVPQSPNDLSGHAGIELVGMDRVNAWHLQDSLNCERIAVPYKPRLQSDDMATLKAAACAGLGVVALPGYVGLPEVRQGHLVRVLPEWIAGTNTLSLLMPSKRGLPPSLRVFTEFLAQRVAEMVAI